VTIKGWLVRRELEPRVLHRLPGRIRFEIPALARVDPRFRSEIEGRLHRARLPVGFNRLNVILATGSVRVEYDSGSVHESDVRCWLEGLIHRTRLLIETYIEMPECRRAAAVEALTEQLDQALGRGRRLDPELVEAHRVSPA